MPAQEHYKSIQDQFAGVAAAPGAPQAAQPAGRGKTIGEMFHSSIPDAELRAKTWEIYVDAMSKIKGVATSDLGSLLTANMTPMFTEVRNTDTVTLNVYESRKTKMLVTDYRLRIPEKAQGVGRKGQKFNPDGTMPTEVSKTRSERTQTLMFIGEELKNSIVGASMVASQQGIDLVADEMGGAMLSMRQGTNYYLLRGVEQTTITSGSIPETGGLLDRTSTYVEDLDYADIGADFIEDQLDEWRPAFGDAFNAMVLTNTKQLRSVRTIEQDRLKGNGWLDYFAFDSKMQERIRDYKVRVDRVFEPVIGNPVPFTHEKDLPANTSLMFMLDYPYLGEFALDGQTGPWAVALPTPTLFKLVCVWYGFANVDPVETSRRKWTNHG